MPGKVVAVVQRDDAVGVLVAQGAVDQGAVVGAERPVLAVAQDVGHELVEDVGDLPVVQVAPADGGGPREAGQVRDDDVEGVGRVAPEGGGVRERVDERVAELTRPRPAVQDQQRRRAGALAGPADEVHGSAVDLDLELVVAVQPLLGRTPVEPVGPVLDQRPEVAGAQAVVLLLVVQVVEEAGRLQACREVVQDVLRHVDREPLRRTVAVVTHESLLSLWRGLKGEVRCPVVRGAAVSAGEVQAEPGLLEPRRCTRSRRR